MNILFLNARRLVLPQSTSPRVWLLVWAPALLSAAVDVSRSSLSGATLHVSLISGLLFAFIRWAHQSTHALARRIEIELRARVGTASAVWLGGCAVALSPQLSVVRGAPEWPVETVGLMTFAIGSFTFVADTFGSDRQRQTFDAWWMSPRRMQVLFSKYALVITVLALSSLLSLGSSYEAMALMAAVAAVLTTVACCFVLRSVLAAAATAALISFSLGALLNELAGPLAAAGGVGLFSMAMALSTPAQFRRAASPSVNLERTLSWNWSRSTARPWAIRIGRFAALIGKEVTLLRPAIALQLCVVVMGLVVTSAVPFVLFLSLATAGFAGVLSVAEERAGRTLDGLLVTTPVRVVWRVKVAVLFVVVMTLCVALPLIPQTHPFGVVDGPLKRFGFDGAGLYPLSVIEVVNVLRFSILPVTACGLWVGCFARSTAAGAALTALLVPLGLGLAALGLVVGDELFSLNVIPNASVAVAAAPVIDWMSKTPRDAGFGLIAFIAAVVFTRIASSHLADGGSVNVITRRAVALGLTLWTMGVVASGLGSALRHSRQTWTETFAEMQTVAQSKTYAEHTVEAYCTAVKGRKPWPARALGTRNAASFMSSRMVWRERQEAPWTRPSSKRGTLQLPESLHVLHEERPFFRKPEILTAARSLDFSWMHELLQFDSWQFDEPLSDDPPNSTQFTPQFSELVHWANLRLAVALERGDEVEASREVRHLALLISGTGFPEAVEMAVVMRSRDRAFRMQAISQGRDVSGWPEWSVAERQASMMGSRGGEYFAPGVAPTVMKRAAQCSVDVCTKLASGLEMHSSSATVFPVDTRAVLEEIIADSGCHGAAFSLARRPFPPQEHPRQTRSGPGTEEDLWEWAASVEAPAPE